eukprot:3757183-Amphidinium_carterae.1
MRMADGGPDPSNQWQGCFGSSRILLRHAIPRTQRMKLFLAPSKHCTFSISSKIVTLFMYHACCNLGFASICFLSFRERFHSHGHSESWSVGRHDERAFVRARCSSVRLSVIVQVVANGTEFHEHADNAMEVHRITSRRSMHLAACSWREHLTTYTTPQKHFDTFPKS